MPDKLTDIEIKKAIECHRDINCDSCPLKKVGYCTKQLMGYAIELIGRYEADVENYKQIAEHQQSVTMDRGFEIKRLKEVLKTKNRELKIKIKTCDELVEERVMFPKKIKTAKAEAYKECIEKVKESASTLVVNHNGNPIKTEYKLSDEALDNLIKEMVGGKNG